MAISSRLKQIFILSLLTGLFLNCHNYKASKPQEESRSPEKIYAEYCAGCHGAKLQKFKNPDWAKDRAIKEIETIIQYGLEEQGMPAYDSTLTQKELTALSQFIMNYTFEDAVDSVENQNIDFDIVTVAEGFDIAWGMEFLPNGDLLIAEKSGHLYRFGTDKKRQEITGLPPIRTKGQGGLMDLKLHPDYENNGWLYISYAYIDEQENRKGNTAIIRAKIKDNQLTEVKQIYKGFPSTNTRYHFGNRMVFDNEGYLYFTNGDRGNRDEYPQKLDNCNGKVHRLNADGSVPADNPFVNQTNAVPSIYSYGHRNPQGIALHPITGEIWEHEHGPKGGDEINRILKGENYGWPVISYGINYSGTKFTDLTAKEGMQQPNYYYVPSIAPCGMAFVTGDRYPQWKNSLLIGSLSFRYLERIQFEGDKMVEREELLKDLDSRVRDVRMSPDGYIYVSLESPGRIVKLMAK